MKYLDWLKTNPEKGYYWVRPYDCYEERIDEFTDWYDNAGNVETKFTEQPDEVISDRLTYINYLDMVGHYGTYSEENAQLKEQLAIAVEALKTIEQKSDKFDDSWGIQEQLDFIKAEAQSKLYQIEELK